MPEPAKKFTGLDLIKVLGVGAAVAAVNFGKNGLGEVVENIEQSSIHVLTEEAIQEHLGLNRNQVELTWAIRNHSLDDKFYDAHIAPRERQRLVNIQKQHGQESSVKTVILGEVAVESLDNHMVNPLVFSIPTLKRVLTMPMIGSDDSVLLKNQEITNDLFLKGYEFMTTDTHPIQLVKDGTVGPDYMNANTFSLVSGLRAILFGIKILEGKEANIQDVKQMSLLTAATFATGVWAEIESELAKDQGKVEGENSNFAKHYYQMETIGESLFKKKPLFTRYTEGIINFRNILMTLNTWHALGQANTKDGRKTDFIFFAGGGHAEADEKFREGPKKLEQELQVYIDRLLDQTLPVFVKGIEESKIDERYAIDNFAGYLSMFSQTQTVGKKYFFEVNDIDTKGTHSALYQLWESIGKKLEKLEEETIREDNLTYKILKGAQFQLLKNIDLNNTVLWNAEKKVANVTGLEATEEIITRNDIGSKIEWFEPRDYFLVPNEVVWTNKTTYRLIIGVAKLNGSIYPVVRKFNVSADKENAIWSDMVTFPAGYITYDGSGHVMPSSRNQSAGILGNNLGFGVALEMDNDQKQTITKGSIVSVSPKIIKDYNGKSPSRYINSDDDPMRMGFVTIKPNKK